MALDNTSLDLFQSETQLEILNDVDKLRSLGIKDLISLPQIVVCGDTSSGKSSLLEALSGVSFPVGSDVCTKFATELILRRSPKSTAKASIQPHLWANEQHVKALSNFSRDFTNLGRNEIENLIEEAKMQMGIKESGGMSDDVLRLNVSGPKKPNLTIVDLPGIIHTSSNQKDVTKVDALVRTYLKEPRSIILVVVSGANPIANQKILSIASEYDREGIRSIGVITKADLLEPDEDVGQRLLALARNEHERFHYQRPWHILRCPSASERKDEKFDLLATEKGFFRQNPWEDFPPSSLGVENLRKSLSDCLLQVIRLELPVVISEIKAKIKKTAKLVEELGVARNTSEEQRRYLTRISRRYEHLTRAALSGDYLNDDDPFFAAKSKRLRAQFRNLSDAFELAMKQRGHTKEIVNSPPSVLKQPQRTGPQLVTKHDALKEADILITSFRGPELPGMFNPFLVSKIFREQSGNWALVAQEYASQVCAATSKFITELLGHICPPNSNTASLLLTELFDVTIQEREKALDSKIVEFLTPYTNALPFSTKARLQASLAPILKEDEEIANSTSTATAPEGLNDAAASCQLLQWSRAYYNVAMDNFIDNVTVLGVENCIAAHLPNLFSPDTVAELSDRKLVLLGGESAHVSSQRITENRKLEILQRSLETCQKHANRELDIKKNAPNGLDSELNILLGYKDKALLQFDFSLPQAGTGSGGQPATSVAKREVTTLEQSPSPIASTTLNPLPKPTHTQAPLLAALSPLEFNAQISPQLSSSFSSLGTTPNQHLPSRDFGTGDRKPQWRELLMPYEPPKCTKDLLWSHLLPGKMLPPIPQRPICPGLHLMMLLPGFPEARPFVSYLSCFDKDQEIAVARSDELQPRGLFVDPEPPSTPMEFCCSISRLEGLYSQVSYEEIRFADWQLIQHPEVKAWADPQGLLKDAAYENKVRELCWLFQSFPKQYKKPVHFTGFGVF